MEEKIYARVRLYMGSPRWMNLVAGLLADVSSMREMVFVKRMVIRRRMDGNCGRKLLLYTS